MCPQQPSDISVVHGFFGRKGGVSTGLYRSLNCGPGSGDEPQAVASNRSQVAQALGLKDAPVLSLYQVHGAACVKVLHPWEGESRPQADAMATDRPGLVLGILTADCVPVLFEGEKPDRTPVIGAAHAGWKGALGGVMEATLETMAELGAQAGTIKAYIGPSIQKRSYEVSQEFYDRFLAQDDRSEGFFQSARRSGHFMFDLPGYCAMRLRGAGVHNIALSDQDTYALEDEFFSYRRATHRQEPDYGRQISAIAIKC